MRLIKFLIIIATIFSYEFLVARDNGDVAISNKDVNLEDYQPFLVDGREWVVSHGTVEFNYNSNGLYVESLYTHQLLTVKVDGEKEIDGILCKRLVIKNEQFKSFPLGSTGTPFCGYCFHILPLGESEIYGYEKDRKLYIYRNPGPYYYDITDKLTGEIHTKLGFGEPYFELYLDLNIHKGDYIPGCGEIIDEYYQDNGDLRCRTLTMQAKNHLNENEVLIEGIGSNVLYNNYTEYIDPEMDIPTCISYTLLVKCTQDGQILYDSRDKLNKVNCNYGEVLSEIKEIFHNTAEKDNSIYNLNGIKVTKTKPGEIYIRDGKKVIERVP